MTAPHTPAERETPAGEAMREAVAQWHESRGFSPRGARLEAEAICADGSPIASELARLTAERDEARAEVEALKEWAGDPEGWPSLKTKWDALVAAAEEEAALRAAAEAALTTLRADAARKDEEIARLRAAGALALQELDWQVEQAAHCGDPNYECPMQDIHAPGDGHLLARNALRAALATTETTDV